MLNIIWVSFFVIAFFSGLGHLLFTGEGILFVRMMEAVFKMSGLAFEIALGLVGVMSFWMGIMKIGEHGGCLGWIFRFFKPLVAKLFPDIPGHHPAFGSMLMNLSANVLGLDNAATPLGLKAMKELQSINPDTESASNSQILFLVLNTSSITIFPITIFTYRAQQGAADPLDVFIPILIATFASTLSGLFAVAWIQGIRILDKVVMAYLVGALFFMGIGILYFASLDSARMQQQSSVASNFLIFSLILVFIVTATLKKVDVYNSFIEGAKEGFQVAVTIIPYLLAMLVAIGVLRASGALEFVLNGVRGFVVFFGLDGQFVEALPTALMKPLSGSGARGLMVEAMQTHGADSLVGRMVAVMQGSTETTFYVLALYFGSVGIKKTRHAIPCGLIADVAGISTAIGVTYLFFS